MIDVDNDFMCWVNAEGREKYAAALGCFVLAFNEVDHRIQNLLRSEIPLRGLPWSKKLKNEMKFSKRLEMIIAIQHISSSSAFRFISCDILNRLNTDRNRLVHGHFDENPFDGTYVLLEKTRISEYPVEKIVSLTDELRAVILQLRAAEGIFGLEGIVAFEATRFAR